MAIAISLPRLRSHIEALSQFGKNPDGQGITRSCWGPAHEEARAWLLGRMKAAGLDTWVDPAGNTFGRLGGGGPTVMTGSHIDTVPQGGPLDGALGVLAGLECLQAIGEAGRATRLPLTVAAWSDEEGRYGSLFGSRAFIGKLDPAAIPGMAAVDGERLVDAMARAGYQRPRGAEGQVRSEDPVRLCRAAHRARTAPRRRAHPDRPRRGHRRHPALPAGVRRRARPRGHDPDGVAQGRLPRRRGVRAQGAGAHREERQRPERDQLRAHRAAPGHLQHRARPRRASSRNARAGSRRSSRGSTGNASRWPAPSRGGAASSSRWSRGRAPRPRAARPA